MVYLYGCEMRFYHSESESVSDSEPEVGFIKKREKSVFEIYWLLKTSSEIIIWLIVLRGFINIYEIR